MGLDGWAVISGGGGGTLTPNNFGTKQIKASGANYTGHTVGGSDNLLILVINFDLGASVPSGVSVTWNSTPMTLAVTASTGGGTPAGAAQVWYLLNPAAGNLNAVVTWTGGSNVFIDSISFSGANSSTPIAHTANNNGTASAPISLTTATGHYAVYTYYNEGGAAGTPTGTQLYVDGVSGSSINAGAGYDVPSGTSITVGGTGAIAIISAVDVSP